MKALGFVCYIRFTKVSVKWSAEGATKPYVDYESVREMKKERK